MAQVDPEVAAKYLSAAFTALGVVAKGYEWVQRRRGTRERETDAPGTDSYADRMISHLQDQVKQLTKERDQQERRANREANRAENYAREVKKLSADKRKRSWRESNPDEFREATGEDPEDPS